MAICTIINKRLNIEISLFLMFFAHMCADTINTNLIIYRTCYVTLNYTESECVLLGKDYSNEATAELEQKVQPHATTVITVMSILQAVFPPTMCFFFGPWSDKYGRKPVLLGTIGGCTLSYLILMVVSIFKFASPWFLLLFSIPHSLTGGIPAFLATVLCFITDTTDNEERAIRIAIYDGVVTLGTVSGQFSSSFLFNFGGYAITYLICFVVGVLAWFYTFLLIPESVENLETKGKLQNLLKFSLLKTTIKTTVKKRENYERSLLLITIIIIVMTSFIYYGSGGVLFLFLRRKFQWTLLKFTLFSGIINAVGMIGTIIGIIFLHKVLHLTETMIMLIGYVSNLTSALLQGFATQDWHIYTAGGIKCIQGVIQAMARYFLSKLVPPEDSGKIFSVLTSLETAFALVGVTAFAEIYRISLAEFPEAFNFVSSGIMVLIMVLILIVRIIERFRVVEKINVNLEAIN